MPATRALAPPHINNNNDESVTHPQSHSHSRRATLATALVTAASTATLLTPQASQAELPGFKKDLTNKRRLKIPEEDYSDGPDGLKYYDVVVGTGGMDLCVCVCVYVVLYIAYACGVVHCICCI